MPVTWVFRACDKEFAIYFGVYDFQRYIACEGVSYFTILPHITKI